MLNSNQQRAFRIAQKHNVTFDPMWEINSSYKLGDDPDFDDARERYKWDEKHNSPKQNYDAIKELELFGMVILIPTGDRMHYAKEDANPTYYVQITSEGLQWQERVKSKKYDAYFDK